MLDVINTDKILEGIKAGGLEAIKIAKQTGTKLVVWRDGKIAYADPEEFEELEKEINQKNK
ncbi:MAG: hypothetical protein AB7U85_06745 [Alphaproteobacteria bacterium]